MNLWKVMEAFESLSLDCSSAQDDTLGEGDLLAMSNLSISERKTISEDLINRFMPYSPTCPSPLRVTVSIPESESSDRMDIDDDDLHSITMTKNDEIDEVNTEDGDEDIDSNERAEQTGLIKALLSPTSLGIALATKDLEKEQQDGIPYASPSVSEACAIESLETDAKGSFTNSNQVHESYVSEEIKSKYGQPWQIQVNNHHYYVVPNNNQPEQAYLPQRTDINDLPVPWSSKSNPASKASYALTTYLQMTLNIVTIMIVCSTITAFAKAVRTDIKSTWEHRKLELDYESSNCKVLYLANHCSHDEIVPALVEQCNEWEHCMNRNNDLYFRARTSLGARLFGEIINSLIDPLGWKAVFVILLCLLIWCFSSNFVLGFMRAKSYYGPLNNENGDENKRLPSTQKLYAYSPETLRPNDQLTMKTSKSDQLNQLEVT